MTDTEKAARAMMHPNSIERKTAEEMFGCKFEDMTKEQRILAAQMVAAWKKLTGK